VNIERDGVFVRDENGKPYLESPIRIVVRQPGFLNDVGIVLAMKLLSIAPVPVSKAFFVNAGTGPAKKKIISRSKAYHGVTVASASLTGLPNNHRDFDLPIANLLHVQRPHWYRFA
jgi:4-aminobutyrate--pyruvate transaminase